MPFVSLLSFLYYNIFCQKNQPLLYQYNCYYEKTGSEVKNITDEIPFDIPDTWCFTRFSSLILINGGYAFKSENYIGKENGVRVLRISDFNEKGFNQKRPVYHKYTPELKPFELEVNDIIMCMTGGTVGKSYFVSELPEPMLVNQRVADIKINDILNKKYCYHFILSPYIQRIIDESKNSTNDNISVALINSFIVPVPPLAEQERIVAEIEKFEPLIAEYDKLEQQATKLDGEIYDKLKKSILQYAIQSKLVPQNSNDEPAAVLLERIRAEKKAQLGKKYVESYIYKGDDNCYYEHINGKNIDITEILPIDIPDNWIWVKLGDICFVTKLAGFEYTKYIAPNLTTAGVPIFKGKNVQDGEIIYKFEGYIPESISDMLERSQVRKKCILTPYVGTIGNLGIHNRNGHYHLGSNVGKIELLPYNITSEEYIVLYLKSIYGYGELTKNKKATAQESISIEAIREVYIPIPPLAEQKRIVEKIDEIFAKL